MGGKNDGGVDVIAKKNGQKLLIQCKRYKSSTVSVHDVRDFYGTLANNLADGKGVFVTTNIFSSEAEKFAEGKPIELLNGSRLMKLIKMAGNKPETRLEEGNTEECPKCGGKVLLKDGKFGKFYGCSKFPTCKFTRDF